MIQRGNAPSEKHKIETKDGYILTLHRILPKHVNENNRKVILLMHGSYVN